MTVNLNFLPSLAAVFLLMFARLGSMVMLMPGFGEQGIPMRIRLVIAVMLTLVMLPLHQNAYALDLAQGFAPMLGLLIKEVIIGIVLGLAGRLTISALQTAGSVIAQQLGLGFVTAVDPTQGQQGLIVGNFLTLLGVTLIFATDLHYMVIAGLHDSYRLFRPGEVPAVSDVTTLVTNTVAGAFRVGIQLSGPFLVFGLVFNGALGVLSRLMPQMQVYFVAVPLSIMIGFLILIAVVGAMMNGFLDYVGSVLREIAPYS